jgi:hypothetical protein
MKVAPGGRPAAHEGISDRSHFNTTALVPFSLTPAVAIRSKTASVSFLKTCVVLGSTVLNDITGFLNQKYQQSACLVVLLTLSSHVPAWLVSHEPVVLTFVQVLSAYADVVVNILSLYVDATSRCSGLTTQKT